MDGKDRPLALDIDVCNPEFGLYFLRQCGNIGRLAGRQDRTIHLKSVFQAIETCGPQPERLEKPVHGRN